MSLTRRGRHRRGAPVTAAQPGRWDGVHRDSARRLDQTEPAWTVWYGVGTRRFYAVAAWPAPEPLIVHARTPDELRHLMRGTERAAQPYGAPVPADRPAPPPLSQGGTMPGTPYGPRTAQWTLPHDLSVIGKTRGLVQETLTAWGLGRLADDVVLAAGELLANAVSYGEPLVRLTLRAEDTALWVEVTDRGPELPRRLNLGLDAVHGRGLTIVEALSDAFGVTPLPDTPGKTVWARWSLPR
ncbi:ATP-binding protein [Streptosporangium sp. NPDC048047]|uniref:ATP-binding protein n=1 Tax=Streptosporangium sp. NPDC048047 TaxID=3155748 RepID=UPI003427AC86